MTSELVKETDEHRRHNDAKDGVDDGDDDDEILRAKLRAYDCNICLDMANDPVVSYCGHLFCWPCLHQWLETCQGQKICPVCKALVNETRVVPLYGRGCENVEDPRKKHIPPRPAGERSEAHAPNMFGDWVVNDGFYITLGVGTLPFFLFSSLFNFSFHIPALLDFRNRRDRSQRYSEARNFLRRLFPSSYDEILPHLFFWLGVFFILWLIFS